MEFTVAHGWSYTTFNSTAGRLHRDRAETLGKALPFGEQSETCCSLMPVSTTLNDAL